jgi:hypothetical protein
MEPVFDMKKMERLAEKDKFVMFLFKDLCARNPTVPAEQIMEAGFNSTVLEDSFMQDIYESC